MLNKMNKKKKGFTLIELVIVLAVLAIIALIAIPNFTKVREDSQIKSDARSLEAIAKVIDMEIIDENIADDQAAADITINIDSAGVVSATYGTGLTPKVPTDVTRALSKVKAPQEKNKTKYVITVTQGEVTKMTTTK